MIPPEKPDIIFLRNRDGVAYDTYTVRIVNMEGKPNTEKFPTNSISQIKDAKFDKLDISNISFNMENEEAIIDLIRAQKIVNFPT
jgi:exosome complex RNA-binding protein Csl4